MPLGGAWRNAELRVLTGVRCGILRRLEWRWGCCELRLRSTPRYRLVSGIYSYWGEKNAGIKARNKCEVTLSFTSTFIPGQEWKNNCTYDWHSRHKVMMRP